jgi:purine-binding chemotaxis protein CheW
MAGAMAKGKKKEGSAELESPSTQEELNERLMHMVIFKLGSEEYGIRIEQVKEVTITPPVAQVPRTNPFIKGVANIRGDIIALMDLEERFGLPIAREKPILQQERSFTLVIDVEQFTVGLLVREVPQSLTIPVSKVDTTPGLIKETGFENNFIEGIAKFDQRLIIVLDMEKILSMKEIEMLETQV